jgi:hypothetical protein
MQKWVGVTCNTLKLSLYAYVALQRHWVITLPSTFGCASLTIKGAYTLTVEAHNSGI